MQNTTADLELIKKVLNGNQSAYADLVRRHQRFVFTMALRFCKKREDAEEVSQDCFIKAYRSLNTFKQNSKFSTWLYSIVYTTAMTSLRKRQLNTESIDDEKNGNELIYRIIDDKPDVLEQKSKSVFLNQAINQLMPLDATIITLFYQGEQSLEEIGLALNMETNTIKVKLFRARTKLKEKLEQILRHEVNELL